MFGLFPTPEIKRPLILSAMRRDRIWPLLTQICGWNLGGTGTQFAGVSCSGGRRLIKPQAL